MRRFEVTKFYDVPAENVAKVFKFIASSLNCGKAPMYMSHDNNFRMGEDQYEYQHVTHLETEPGSTTQHFHMKLRIEHNFGPKKHTNYVDGRGWCMADTGKPKIVEKKVIQQLHEALGIFQ